MGFGYAFLGYLVLFVMTAVLKRVGFGFAGQLAGILLMLAGFRRLAKYERNFRFAEYALFAMLIPALYTAFCELSALLGFVSAFACEENEVIFNLLFAVVNLAFHGAFLFAVGSLAKQVGLLRIRASAFRNGAFVAIWGVLFLVGSAVPAAAKGYFALPVLLSEVVWIACNLFLLLTCSKDICPAGEEEILPRDSKIALLNTLRDTMDTMRDKAYNKLRREAEENRKKKNNRK